jgi:hypothetical protein
MTFHLLGAAWNDMTPPMAGELRNERLELFLFFKIAPLIKGMFMIKTVNIL